MLHRDAWLEIDLAAIGHNVDVIRDVVGPRALVAPVVKADAYGHGLVAVGRSLDGAADALCVASLDEGLQLRAAGVMGRIVILYPVPATGVGEAAAAALELTIMGADDVLAVRTASAAAGAETQAADLVVHLAVETGLARGGLEGDDLLAAARDVDAMAGVAIGGLWSHLASPGDPEACALQMARFDRATADIARSGVPLPPRHVAASGAIFGATAPGLDMVRPGLATYGLLDPGSPVAPEARAGAGDLRPALSLKARAVAFCDVPPGGSVGYGGRWQAERPSRIAILPVGYADGYARGTQPGATALVRGRRVPLAGAVSMDALAVDVTDVEGVGHADEFVLLGGQGSESITAMDLARARNTIAYEVLSGMTARLDRVYHPSAGNR